VWQLTGPMCSEGTMQSSCGMHLTVYPTLMGDN